MEYQSPYSIDIPITDIPTFIFSSGTATSRTSPQFFDAENPVHNFSLQEAEVLVKQVAKGLQNLGLEPDDKVLVCAGNALHFPVLIWGIIAARCVFTACNPASSVQGQQIVCQREKVNTNVNRTYISTERFRC